MDTLMQQGPDGLTREVAEELLKKVDGDVVKALCLAWDVSEAPKKERTDVQKAWDQRREVYDAYDHEMEKYLKNMGCEQK